MRCRWDSILNNITYHAQGINIQLCIRSPKLIKAFYVKKSLQWMRPDKKQICPQRTRILITVAI